MSVHIRWIISRDRSEVLAIERQSFGPEAWGQGELVDFLKQRHCIGMVAERGEKVVGFMIYELHKSKLVLTRFAVAKEYRRQGVGTLMITKLVDKLAPDRRKRIVVEVPDTNLQAQLFFAHRGFRAVRVVGDCYRMEYRLRKEEECRNMSG